MATTIPRRTLVPDDLEARAIAWRRHLHANPELSFEEHETSAFVEETLRSFGGLEIERPAGTAVVARLRGARPGKVVALRADIDALPIHEENDVPYASTRPGMMHACGHDGHTAMLLAAAQLLVERRDELAGEVISSSSTPRSSRPAAPARSRGGALDGASTSSRACTSSRLSRPGTSRRSPARSWPPPTSSRSRSSARVATGPIRTSASTPSPWPPR